MKRHGATNTEVLKFGFKQLFEEPKEGMRTIKRGLILTYKDIKRRV